MEQVTRGRVRASPQHGLVPDLEALERAGGQRGVGKHHEHGAQRGRRRREVGGKGPPDQRIPEGYRGRGPEADRDGRIGEHLRAVGPVRIRPEVVGDLCLIRRNRRRAQREGGRTRRGRDTTRGRAHAERGRAEHNGHRQRQGHQHNRRSCPHHTSPLPLSRNSRTHPRPSCHAKSRPDPAARLAVLPPRVGAARENEGIGSNGDASPAKAIRALFEVLDTTDSSPAHQVDRTLRVCVTQGHGQPHDLPQLKRLIRSEVHPGGAQIPSDPRAFAASQRQRRTMARRHTAVRLGRSDFHQTSLRERTRASHCAKGISLYT